MYIGDAEIDIINSSLGKYGPEFVIGIVSNEMESKALYTFAQVCNSLNKETRDALISSISQMVEPNGLTTGKTFGR